MRPGTGALAVLVDAGVGLKDWLTLFDTELETELDTELDTELEYEFDTDQDVEMDVVQDTELEVVIDTVLEMVIDTLLEVVMDTEPETEPVPEIEGVFVAACALRRHDSRTAKTTKALDIMFVAEL